MQRGSAFVRRSSRDLDLIFALQFERTVNRDNTVSIQNLRLQIEPVRWRSTPAGCTVKVHQHLDGTFTITYGPQASGALQCGRSISKPRKNRQAWGCGKDARWKSQKADFPTSLGNPANCAGFPLSHSHYGCWLNLKPDISLATKTGHFNLLPTLILSRKVDRAQITPLADCTESMVDDTRSGNHIPRRGNSIATASPDPVFRTRMVPLCSSTARDAIARPNPCPSDRRDCASTPRKKD